MEVIVSGGIRVAVGISLVLVGVSNLSITGVSETHPNRIHNAIKDGHANCRFTKPVPNSGSRAVCAPPSAYRSKHHALSRAPRPR